MYRFNGAVFNPTYAHTGVPLSLGEAFVFGATVRTSTAAQRAIMGFSNDNDNWLIVWINRDDKGDSMPGGVYLALCAGGNIVDIVLSAPQLFDGQAHQLAIARYQTDLITVWVDNVAVAEEVDASALSGAAFAVDRPFALGGFYNDSSVESGAAVDIGEFWLINSMPVSWAFRDWLLAGLSAGSIDVGIDYYWPGWHSNDAVIGNDTLINNGQACAHPIIAITGDWQTPEAYGPINGPRYEVFVSDGSPADPAMVAPTCVVPRAYAAPQLYGTLPPSSTAVMSVYAANASGRSEGSTISFPTDVNGEPSLVPSVPTEVRAVPLTGGLVRLSWRYHETSPIAAALAAEFLIAFTPLDDVVSSPIPIIVPYEPGEFNEMVLSELATGGRWLITVWSRSALGATAGPSGPAMVTVDNAAPVIGAALTLGAA